MKCPKCQSTDFTTIGEEGKEVHFCWSCSTHWTDWQQDLLAEKDRQIAELVKGISSIAEHEHCHNSFGCGIEFFADSMGAMIGHRCCAAIATKLLSSHSKGEL